MYAYQSRTCTGTVGKPRNRMRRTTMMVLDAALGENLYSDGPDRWGSLACMRRQASSFTSSMITAVRGIKKDDTDDAKEFSADHSSHKGVQRRKSHGFPTTRG